MEKKIFGIINSFLKRLSFKVLFVFLFFSLTAFMCSDTEQEIYELKADSHYFVGLLDPSGAGGMGHVGFLLVQPNQVTYCSFNGEKELHFPGTLVFAQANFDTYVRAFVFEEDEYVSQITPSQKLIWNEINRYDRGFIIALGDDSEYYNRIADVAINNRQNFNLATYNCLIYMVHSLSTIEPDVMNVISIWKIEPNVVFDDICHKVGGTPFFNYKEWVNKVSRKSKNRKQR